MHPRRLRFFTPIASVLMLAAFALPFAEVGGLFDDVGDDDGQSLGTPADRSQLQRRSSAPPESPEGSCPPGAFAIALGFPSLEPRFPSEPGELLASPRPGRASWLPRDLERGPPAGT